MSTEIARIRACERRYARFTNYQMIDDDYTVTRHLSSKQQRRANHWWNEIYRMYHRMYFRQFRRNGQRIGGAK